MKKFCFLLLLLVLNGCATMSKMNGVGSESTISIVDSRTGSLVDGVKCVVRYKGGTGTSFSTPKFQISSSIDFHYYPHLSCKKSGYRDINNAPLDKTLDPGIMWNILVPPLFLVDGIMGNSLMLKKNITIKMVRL